MQTEQHHSIEMCENKYTVIHLHGTFKHKKMLPYANVSLFMQHHIIASSFRVSLFIDLGYP